MHSPSNELLGLKRITLSTGEVLDRQALVERLGAGSLSRVQAVRMLVESREVVEREQNEAFVYMQYVGYHRREPEEEGLKAWLKVINENPSDRRMLVSGFINSTEYRLRFGQP